jgi:hypothetical protein
MDENHDEIIASEELGSEEQEAERIKAERIKAQRLEGAEVKVKKRIEIVEKVEVKKNEEEEDEGGGELTFVFRGGWLVLALYYAWAGFTVYWVIAGGGSGLLG